MTVDDGPPTGRRETGDREVTVVGAGAVGITTAHDLARAGADVTVYERAEVAGGASGRAAGVCYDAFATRPDAELGATAIERFRAFAAEGAPFTPCPYVWLAREGDERVALVREGIERMHELGTDVIELDAAALGERFPALRTDDVAIAGLTTGAGFADTGAYTAWLAARARAAGATIREERPVDLSTDPPGVVPRTGPKAGRLQETGTLVVAAGARSKRLLADAGVSIPMKPYRVQALVGALGDDWPPAGRSPAASGAAIKRLSHTVGQKYVNICPSDEGTEGREARDARPATSGARRDQRERLGLRERRAVRGRPEGGLDKRAESEASREQGAVSGPDTPESRFHTGGRKSARIFVRQYQMPMWYDASADCYARPHPAGLLAGDGTEPVEADPESYDREANEGFADGLAARVTHRLPDCALDVQRAWAGLCTATPDRDPLVGELRDGVYVATGFQGQGFMRSPAIGQRLAGAVLGGEGIPAFDPLRFDGDEAFEIREGMAVEG